MRKTLILPEFSEQPMRFAEAASVVLFLNHFFILSEYATFHFGS